MELAFNILWLLTAALLLGLWATQRRTTKQLWLGELLAIFALLFVLFPVVSVTDDLLIATNVTEGDTTVRRVQDGTQPHSTYPAYPIFLCASAISVPEQHVGEILRPSALPALPASGRNSALANRPPPVA